MVYHLATNDVVVKQLSDMRSVDETNANGARYTSRLLTIEDFAEVKAVYRSASSWMGLPVEQSFLDESLDVVRNEYLQASVENKILIGTFRDDQLILCGGLYFWSDMPFCTVLRMVGHASTENPRLVVRSMRVLYDCFLDEIERRQCTRFYILTAAKHHKMMAIAGRSNPRISRDYLMTLEDAIAPGDRPRHRYVWEMMGQKVWSTPLVVRAGTALNHIRKIDFSLVDLAAIEAWGGGPTSGVSK